MSHRVTYQCLHDRPLTGACWGKPTQGDGLFYGLMRDDERQNRRRASIKRFLLAHRGYELHFLLQTFASDFAGNNERAARTRLAPLKKCLARYGEFLVVWERGEEGNRIHAHIIFAMRRRVTIKYLQRLMAPVGFLKHKPITYRRYNAMARYLADYVSKDLRYRYTASVSLRSLPSLWRLVGAERSDRLATGQGAGGDSLLSPPRPVTFSVVGCSDSNGVYRFEEDSVYRQMTFKDVS